MAKASAFSDFILSFAKMVGSALNLEYKSVVVCVPPGGSISSSVRPTVYADNSLCGHSTLSS